MLDLSFKFKWDNINGSTTELDSYVDARAEEQKKKQCAARFSIEEITTNLAFNVGDWVNNVAGRNLAMLGQIVMLRHNILMQTTEITTETLAADVLADTLPKKPPAPPAKAAPHSGSQPTLKQLHAHEQYQYKLRQEMARKRGR